MYFKKIYPYNYLNFPFSLALEMPRNESNKRYRLL